MADAPPLERTTPAPLAENALDPKGTEDDRGTFDPFPVRLAHLLVDHFDDLAHLDCRVARCQLRVVAETQFSIGAHDQRADSLICSNLAIASL
jgi:hypothetical protein